MLVVSVNQDTLVSSRSRRWRLPRASYLYVGSAGGPGGLAARISRHLRRDKKPFWHIDYLTINNVVEVEAIVFSTRSYGVSVEARLSECLLSKGLKPIEGFGSSDDKRATSHLYMACCLQEALSIAVYCMLETLGSAEVLTPPYKILR